MSKTIVALDLKGYSSLSKEGQEAVFHEFLNKVSRHLSDRKKDLIDVNTWGDAVTAVFNKAIPAVEYALEVRDLVRNRTGWACRELNICGSGLRSTRTTISTWARTRYARSTRRTNTRTAGEW